MKFPIPFEMYSANGSIGSTAAARTAGETLAAFTPPVKGYLCGITVMPTTNIDPGSTTAGTIAAYKNTTELGALDLTADQDVGESFAIPLTTAPNLTAISITPTDVVAVKVKTTAVGGTLAGVFRGTAWFAMDERETTTPTFLEPYRKF
jgi:hypothetical protein